MRYFIEVSYKGANYAGFQIQHNANTIQHEVERALRIFFKQHIKLTGSSRTDAGVHAKQNYFHADFATAISPKVIFNLNALLPADIAIKSIQQVADDAHARFDAISREYLYHIYTFKDPFLHQTAWYYPYKIEMQSLHDAAALLMNYTDFTSFAKRNSQVSTHNCTITQSRWLLQQNSFVYQVQANRFLRGMVRGLVGTMLQVSRGAMTLQQFAEVIEAKDCTKANFSTPAHGLFLNAVTYPAGYFRVADGVTL